MSIRAAISTWSARMLQILHSMEPKIWILRTFIATATFSLDHSRKICKWVNLKIMHFLPVYKLCKYKNFDCKLSGGFYGTLNGRVQSKNIKMQLSEIVGRSKLISTNAVDFSLGLGEEIAANTHLKIKSSCPIHSKTFPNFKTKSDDGVFLLQTGHGNANRLKIINENGKTMNVDQMSWIDSFKLKTAIVD